MTADLRDRLQSSLANTYTLDRELGGGGMSRVFTAKETALGRSVVVKVLPPELAAGVSTERFKREIAVAARLQHPHIVPLLSAGETAGLPYFTMPFVEGESLRTRLARRGELPISESVRILREIASALAYAHEHGVVHRDIKPDNVLFSGDVAMVADFGVAKALSASTNSDHGGVTSLGVALGTPAYMAPEQATADPATDYRADVYAFGVLAYEVLTGQPPFTGRNPSQLLAAHVTELAEPVSRRRPNLPPALAALVMRCLEKRPADRPQSASEIVHALDDITTPSGGTAPTSATLAAPNVGTPSGARGPRRDVKANVLVIAIVVLVLGGSGVAVWRSGAASARTSSRDARARRIAVLPFENLGDSADAYFAAGMTDAVRGKLTGLSNMEVIARASSVQYRGTSKSPAEIARELGARYLLTGTVRWAKASGTSRVQVSPELVEISADGAAASRWQQPFDAEMADVFHVQGEIAGKVAEAMRVAISGADHERLSELPTSNPAAYDAFLKAEAIVVAAGGDPAGLRRAISEYQRAVTLDTAFSDAWAQLSNATSLLYTNAQPTSELARQARTTADRALQLSPTGARGHRALGNYFRLVEIDGQRALAEMEKARAAAPADADVIAGVGSVLMATGRFEDAVRELRAAQRLDPRSPAPGRSLSRALFWLHRYDEAREVTDHVLALSPSTAASIEARAMVELGAGNLDEARRVTQAASAAANADAVAAYFARFWDVGWALDEAGQQRALSLGADAFDNDRANMAIVRAQLYGWRGDSARVRVWADTAEREFAAQVRDTPDDAQRRAFHGLALAYLGRHVEAIAEGERGLELLPVERDAFGGPYQMHLLARIYLLVGEREKALDLIERLLKIPYFLSPGWLRIDPTFAPLKGTPRFEKLIARR
jgi:serine/threonine-protein kinase